ncbi:hypothetical protein [Hymenobacter cellulosilyticus]|uniref:Uncharacterized protein n=1 Tax=Hymenobacter cellulosilyticus TaxID=2932248 RepID=A0A8T9QBJ9_9BACT|nr:hypothetical protein [Hymenobacter cellulosilyticus]UOQ73498.1 hypothetical protein MUN79_06060 [Hymenobacter cellulosilyticus]
MSIPGSARPTSSALLVGIGLLFVLEVLFFTYLRNSLGPYWSPVVLYGLSLGLCLLTARAVLDFRFEWPAVVPSARPRLGAAVALTLISGLITAPVVRKLVAQFVVSTIGNSSDIVPALQVYVTRFLGPDAVYRPITLLGYTFLPNYPPLQWLPFVPAELLGVDYRAWAFGLLLLALLFTYQWRLVRLGLPLGEWLLKAVLPVLVVHFVVLTDKSMFGLTVESLIIGYYCVLAAGTLSGKPWLKALGWYCVCCRAFLWCSGCRSTDCCCSGKIRGGAGSRRGWPWAACCSCWARFCSTTPLFFCGPNSKTWVLPRANGSTLTPWLPWPCPCTCSTVWDWRPGFMIWTAHSPSESPACK